MNIEWFQTLSMPQQFHYTLNYGGYLLTRHEKTFSADLFQVLNFYVEIYYEHGETMCALIRGFQSTVFLEPYLIGIDVQGLLGD